ncbi:DUF2441 domain-containing protein [Flavobacterium sp.]|uniref:DUF2441 domain-containing protein n=1 Tax=Flavobacterium sp. TaxID=239 RepID=UPI00374CFBAC
MQVVDKELFHIHRKNHHQDLWKPGNILETPKDEFNHFYKGLSTEPHRKVSKDFEQFELIDYLNKNIDELEKFNNSIDNQELNQNNVSNIQGFNSHIFNLLKQTFHSLAQSRKMLREIIFEDCRTKYFFELPSRQKCFWLSDKEQIEKWWTEFNDNENKLICKVSVTGNLFHADGSFIQMDIFKFTDFNELANKYWHGQINSNSDLIQKEIIFEGKLKILSKYDNPSEL